MNTTSFIPVKVGSVYELTDNSFTKKRRRKSYVIIQKIQKPPRPRWFQKEGSIRQFVVANLYAQNRVRVVSLNHLGRCIVGHS